MNSIINLLSPDQINFIIATYGSVTTWVGDMVLNANIAIEDIIL